MRRSADFDAKSRSEAVRMRRAQHSQDRQKRAAKTVHYQANTPTVLVRNGGFGTPVVRRAKNPVRRPLVIPLSTPGAEVVMPGVPEVKVGWRLLSALMVFVFGALIALVYSAPELRIEAPSISGLQRLNPADINAVLKVEGLQIFKFDPQVARQELQSAFPELKNIEIQVKLPRTVAISVVERQPVVAWRNNEQTNWIDEEGVVFPPRGEAPALLTIDGGDLPLISAPESETDAAAAEEAKKRSTEPKRIRTEILKAGLRLSEMLPVDTILAYTPEDGLGWVAPDGWKVYVGSTLEDLNLKIAIYQRISENITAQGVTPSMISVEYLHAPFYRVE